MSRKATRKSVRKLRREMFDMNDRTTWRLIGVILAAQALGVGAVKLLP